MAELIDEIRVDENGVMLRPARRDPLTRRRAAEMALLSVKRWLGPEWGNDTAIIKELMKHIDGHDGFHIAKSLDNAGWSSDDSLVEIMSLDHIRQAEEELTRQWVRCLGVKLSLSIGTAVEYRGERGTIARHDAELAKYGIQVPSQAEGTHWIINAEDAKLAPEILQEQVA